MRIRYNRLVTFAEYIESKYLEWQRTQGKRKTLEQFAAYIGVSRPLLNMWMNGHRTPGLENVHLLAEIFGNEVYDITGYEQPNPYLQKINRLFEKLTPEHQRQLAEQAEHYQTQNHDALRTTPKTRKQKPAQ